MVVVFRSRNMSLRPIDRIKHVFDKQAGVTLNVVEATNIVTTVDNPVRANTSEVATGSKINAFFCIVEVSATTGAALPNCYMIIGKSEGGNITLPNPNVVGASTNKRYVIHQEMVMLSKDDTESAGLPRTLYKGVIVIPRGMRRNGPGDIWQLNVLAPGVNLDLCIQVHYKEFR